MFKKENIKYYVFITLATLFIGVCFTSADFFTSPVVQFKDSLILFLQWGVLVLALWPVMYLLSLNRYIFGIIFPILMVLCSVLMYFRYATGTILTTMILDVALNNDQKLTYELISPELIAVIIFSFLMAILFVFYRFRTIKPIHPWVHLAAALVLFGVLFNISHIKAPIAERIPFNLYFITSRYLAEKKEIAGDRKRLSENITCKENDPLLVLCILGESLRSDHLGLNGYQRNTTPNLSKEDIISFPHIYSEYTYTNASVPHILTRADSIYPDRAYSERSFIDLFKQCGYYTSWLANQESAKSYVYFMNECDTLVFHNMNKSSYVFDQWLDEDMLPGFQALLQKENQKQLVIMHTIGSHWYYNAHFPEEFQQYNPITQSRIVASNSPEEMINSYDNTVLYTDYFLATVIRLIKNKKAVVFYLSDHAEALGEDGVWLHATDVPAVHRTACFIWMSETYKNNYHARYRQLQLNKNNNYRTDFLFPSILEAAGIESPVIDRSLSLFH